MNDHHPAGSSGYGPSWHQPHSPAPHNGPGTTALVLGIVGLVLSVIPIVGIVAWPLVILGVIFGLVGLVRVSRGTATNRGAALAGLICSVGGLVICIAYVVAFGQAVNDDTAPTAPPWLGQADPSFAAAPPTAGPTALYPDVEPTAPTADSIPGSGTFIVGTDVEPGTYRSAPAAGSVMSWCYWSRLSNLDGTLDAIIANDGGSGSKVVTIAPSDRAFETSGCATWQRVR